MARSFRLALVAILTLLGVWILPSPALAAMLPACEVEPAATMVPPAEPVCDVIESSDEATGETSAAPICHPDGASAIAPPRILPVSDARIDAAPSCGDDGLSQGLGQVPLQDQVSVARGAGDVAILPQAPAVLPAQHEVQLPSLATFERASSGFHRGIYHPPRLD
jgi:hypothetical protein